MDVTYARRKSLLLDLRILVLTVPAIIGAKGCS
jgi:lipopolysaccharide/colanic/teichoic acid biosynthesis glycosyltransferase